MKKITLITLMAVAAINANAQRMMGVATSNWAANTNISMNPANIADSRTRFCLDLFGFGFGIDNNLASINLSSATSSTNGVANAGDLLKFSNNKQFNIVMPQAEVRLPGLMYQIDHKNSVAVTTRLRVFNQFNNFDQTLFRTVMDPSFAGSTDYPFSSTKFNWTANIWTEINFSYARVVYEKDEHFLKVGGTIGRMGGVGFISIKGNNLDAVYYGAHDSIHANHTDVQFASSVVDSAGQLAGGFSNVASQFTGQKDGGGWRADIGVVYEYRPDEYDINDHGSNKYKVRGSLSFTDLGSITYKNIEEVKITGNGSMSSGDLAHNFNNSNDLIAYTRSRGFTLDTGKRNVKVSIPSTMILGVDYYIKGHFYANATWIKSIVNRQNYGNSYYGQLTVTPRWDTKIFSFGLPITYSSLTKGMKAGFGVRVAGFYFGSDDMLLFVSNKQYGVNFYLGGFVPINRKSPRHGTKTSVGPRENLSQ
jgi:hypothetical protein